MKLHFLSIPLTLAISGCSLIDDPAINYIKVYKNDFISIKNTSTSKRIRATYLCHSNWRVGSGNINNESNTVSISLEPGEIVNNIHNGEDWKSCIKAKVVGARYINDNLDVDKD